MADNRLDDRHIVVTGAGQGIGRGIAVRAAKSGADITVFDVDTDSARETADRVHEAEVRAQVHEVDVTDPVAIDAGIEAAVSEFGTIDGLVNNAGVQDVIPILETTSEQWDRYLMVNAKGTFLCSKAVSKHMINEGINGSIVNIASMSAVDPGPGQGAYGASKGAVAAFTITLAKELGKHQITANAINPGAVDTPMFRKWLDQLANGEDRSSEAMLEDMETSQSLGRIGRPSDIGNLATFLLSDEAEWISGESFNIKGGPA